MYPSNRVSRFVVCALLRFCLFVSFLVGSQFPSQIGAQTTPASRLAVDTLTSREGKRYRGIILSRDSEGSVRLVVSREWFEQTYSNQYTDHRQVESVDRQRALKELARRVTDWIDEREDDAMLAAFLRDELKRVESAITNSDGDDLSKFTLLSFPGNQIKHIQQQSEQRHRIAAAAWRHGLKDVSTRSANALRRELQTKQILWENEPIDLSHEIPVTTQSAAEFAARRALVEHQLREAVEFQGTDRFLIRKGDAVAAAANVWGQVLNGGNSINQLLNELDLPEARLTTGEASAANQRDKSTRGAVEKAEKEGFYGVLITRMNPDYTSPDINVECEFWAKKAPGKWIPVASFRARTLLDDQTQQDIDALRDDPQIQQLSNIIGNLKVGDAKMLDKALRYGAATQQATADVQKQFLTFANRYVQRLDGPPLSLPDYEDD